MVKCVACGLLARRDFESRALIEVEGGYRERGHDPRYLVPGFKANTYLDEPPLCFAMQWNLPEEVETARRGQGRTGEVVLEVLTRERDCAGFTPWKQGFTPKEHREMVDRERSLRREEETRKAVWEREEKRDAEMRDWQKKRDEDAQRFQASLHRREILILGVVVTIALVLAMLAAAIIEGAVSHGWEPSWWPF